MTVFTEEEYEIMIYELTEKEPMAFDMMLSIAERVLRPIVDKWCHSSGVLKSKLIDSDDAMQEISVRLTKYCVTGFLRRPDHQYEINHNSNEFCAWMIDVAQNYLRTKSKKPKRSIQTVSIIDGIVGVYDHNDEELERMHTIIEKVFTLVFASSRSIHIVLSWITLYSIMIYCNVTKIKATRFMVLTFSKMTLNEMWIETQRIICRIPWLIISQELIEHINDRLNEVNADGESPGSTIYEEYFGKKGGRGVISDWVNRMNSWIKTRIDYESFNN